MRAEKEVIKINRSWAKYMRNISNEKDKIDRAYELRDAYKKGGEERARQEKLTIARNALAEGSTPEFIQKITGLSLEEIQKLSVEEQEQN